jgi:lysozyme family protein
MADRPCLQLGAFLAALLLAAFAVPSAPAGATAAADPSRAKVQRLAPVPAEKPGKCSRASTYAALAAEYRALFDSVVPDPARRGEVARMAASVEANRTRYEAISARTRVPWFFIGLIHGMESGFDFAMHIHNGDPLPGRTVSRPRGRPAAGKPPYSWDDSAVDALAYKRFTGRADWSLARILWRLELYNGFGYRKRGLCSPYLWAFSNHFRGGFYVDGGFDPKAAPRQIGTALVLKVLAERGAIEF